MSIVKIAASFDKDAPEFLFFQIADFVKDFDTTYEDEETVTVQYQVYEEDAAFVENIISTNPGTIIYTVDGIVS